MVRAASLGEVYYKAILIVFLCTITFIILAITQNIITIQHIIKIIKLLLPFNIYDAIYVVIPLNSTLSGRIILK